MDSETITKLIEMFSGLGHEAKWAFFAYLGLHAFKILATAGTIILLAFMACRLIRNCQDDSKTVTALRSLWDDLRFYDHDKLVRRVTELKMKADAK